jgi:hypothetical protein
MRQRGSIEGGRRWSLRGAATALAIVFLGGWGARGAWFGVWSWLDVVTAGSAVVCATALACALTAIRTYFFGQLDPVELKREDAVAGRSVGRSSDTWPVSRRPDA